MTALLPHLSDSYLLVPEAAAQIGMSAHSLRMAIQNGMLDTQHVPAERLGLRVYNTPYRVLVYRPSLEEYAAARASRAALRDAGTCKRGHPWADWGIVVGNGQRQCRICRLVQQRKRRGVRRPKLEMGL